MNTWTRRVILGTLIVSNMALGAPAAESPRVYPLSDIDQKEEFWRTEPDRGMEGKSKK